MEGEGGKGELQLMKETLESSVAAPRKDLCRVLSLSPPTPAAAFRGLAAETSGSAGISMLVVETFIRFRELHKRWGWKSLLPWNTFVCGVWGVGGGGKVSKTASDQPNISQKRHSQIWFYIFFLSIN